MSKGPTFRRRAVNHVFKNIGGGSNAEGPLETNLPFTKEEMGLMRVGDFLKVILSQEVTNALHNSE